MNKPTNKVMAHLVVMSIMLLSMCNSCSSDFNDTISSQEETSSKEQVVAVDETSAEFDALSNAIYKKASAFLANQGESPQFLGFLSKLFKTVAADVCSTVMSMTKGYDFEYTLATAGNASTRAGQTGTAEIWKWTIEFSNTPIINTINNQGLVSTELENCISSINASGKSISEENIGLWHNAIIIKSFINGLRFDSDDEEITDATIESLNWVNSRSFESCQLVKTIDKNTIHDLTNTYYAIYHKANPRESIQCIKDSQPTYNKEVNLLTQYFNDLELCQDLASANKITEIYITEIESSTIPTKSKKLLLTALSVAKSSASLWDLIYSNIDSDLSIM